MGATGLDEAIMGDHSASALAAGISATPPRRTRRTAALLMTFALAAAVLSACSGGGGSSKTPTIAAAPTKNPVITDATPLPPPVVQGNKYLSTLLKYSVQFPDGWTPDQGIVRTPTLTTDVFLSPTMDNGVTPNVSVTCDRSYMDSAAFLAAKRAFATQFATNGVTDVPATVAGSPAVRLSYDQTSGSATVHKSESHLFSQGCAWTITLTESKGKDYSNVYDLLVKSFQFVA